MIGSKLFSLMEEFKITKKVDKIVTDNGSNFVKAFGEYGKADDEGEDSQVSDDDDDSTVDFISVGDLFDETSEEERDIK